MGEFSPSFLLLGVGFAGFLWRRRKGGLFIEVSRLFLWRAQVVCGCEGDGTIEGMCTPKSWIVVTLLTDILLDGLHLIGVDLFGRGVLAVLASSRKKKRRVAAAPK